MMVLVPSIRRAFPDRPLIAAGGVADGAGMVAVMALGAEGVQVGTRFMATLESSTAESVVQLILSATDTSTMIADNKFRPRVSRPELAEAVIGKRRQSQMGQVAALINDVKTVEEVIRELVFGGAQLARQVADSLNTLTGPQGEGGAER
jgi:NAD(P)H-dependent flavin oxidoreductase YrpB (nitropropane dioxygenase family)